MKGKCIHQYVVTYVLEYHTERERESTKHTRNGAGGEE